MGTVRSNDGTTIAYDRHGEGPPVILVGGAFQRRAFDPSTVRLAELLAAAGLSVFHSLVNDSRPPLPDDYVAHLDELIAAGRRGDAVEYFMTTAVAIPPEVVAQMRDTPMWEQPCSS